MDAILSDKIASKDNNFNFLRLLSVTLVIFAHSFDLLKCKDPLRLATGDMSFGTFAVYILCIVSGFLITKSWLNNPNLITFFKKRLLRIFPALVSCILFTVFAVGPLVTIMPIDKYFANPWTYDYLKNVFLFIEALDRLPGVFIFNPLPYVNGSLWFLPIIVFLYGSLAILGMLTLVKRRFFIVLILPLLLFLYFHTDHSMGILGMNVGWLLKLSFFFFSGSVFYLYAEKIVLNAKLALLAMTFLLISMRSPIGLFLCFLSLPYLILYFAFSEVRFIKGFAGRTDLSYGLFIYAFPLQQTLLHFFKDGLNTSIFFILSWILTFIIAYLSWHLVEKHFLRQRVTKASSLILDISPP
ncbi:MAG: acyltransferase [Thermodesulfovibrionales bacterium]|nr:acyltransferase [Thermodesulfovibrionales bacterium]